MGFRELFGGVPQNSSLEAKCPGFFLIMEIRRFWQSAGSARLSHVGRKRNYASGAAINRPQTGRNRRGRGRSV